MELQKATDEHLNQLVDWIDKYPANWLDKVLLDIYYCIEGNDDMSNEEKLDEVMKRTNIGLSLARQSWSPPPGEVEYWRKYCRTMLQEYFRDDSGNIHIGIDN